MPLVKAQCENCNSILSVDSTKRAAICEFCGTPYVVQDAINNYSTHIEHLHANVVNIHTGQSKQDLLKNADKLFELAQFDRAKKAYEKVIEKYPEEPQGWWGAYKVVLSNFTYFHELADAYQQYASTAMKLHDYTDEYHKLWEALVATYSKELHTRDNADYVWDSVSLKDIELMLYTSIDSTKNPYLKQLQAATFNNYYHAFKAGKVSFFNFGMYGMQWLLEGRESTWRPSYDSPWHETCKLENIPILQKIFDEGCQNAADLFPGNKLRNMSFLKDYIQYASTISEGRSFNRNLLASCIGAETKEYMLHQASWIRWDDTYRVVFFLGKTIILERVELDFEYRPPEISHFQIILTKNPLSSTEIRQLATAQWKKEKRCAHCGGTLTRGLFSTKCDDCGQKKDY